MNVLLHTCCGPCACACVPRLKAAGHDVTLLFANSNIDTAEEFEKRRAAAERLAAIDGVGFAALPYDHADWLSKVARGFEDEPERGRRCARCFRYNLAQAAAFAKEHGLDAFTTSLTVSPHKVSSAVFAAGDAAAAADGADAPAFLHEDFKKREGFKLSVRRAAELGLYRQSYCGCEFSHRSPKAPTWRLHHRAVTESTNLDARAGVSGDVFTADFQTAGRGRLDHRWLSPPGANLMMSVVLDVGGLSPEQVSILPLVVGLSVCEGLSPMLKGLSPALKWPNDVLVDGRKLAGILCERTGDRVIVGLGVNVNQTAFTPEIAARATSLACLGHAPASVAAVRDAVLARLGETVAVWRARGFAALYPRLAAHDCLRGQSLCVRQTDDDAEPLRGVSGGILPDGSLDVGGVRVYAGEAHVERIGG